LQPANRLGAWTACVVIGTALMVGGGAALWNHRIEGGIPLSLWVTLACGAVAALAAALAVERQLSPPGEGPALRVGTAIDAILRGPALDRLRPDEDPDAAMLVRAVNGLLDRVQGRWDALASEAAAGRSAMEASPNGVLVVGKDGRIRYVNPAFRRLVDVVGETDGRPPIEAVHVAEVQLAVEDALRNGQSEELACKPGRFDLTVRGVRTADGGAMVLLQDVTGFRTAERARTEFVANVSHELRTPIATIMGYSETLVGDSDRLDAETQMVASAIHRNAIRLRDLFEDLLELSRIELRRRELPLERQSLRPLVEKAVAGAAEKARSRNQTFEVDCPPELVAAVNAEAFATIVGNLAHNASNYTPEGGHVRVIARMFEREAQLTVMDDGIGIDRLHHERIFERFYRVDEGRSRKVGGTGLGLAIVKHLAAASGAKVSIASELGKGSAFTVHVPLQPPAYQRAI
jgi:two-component system phosphate regulon sensor histidine kinase PhoR